MADDVNAQKTLSKKRDKVLFDKKRELKSCNDQLTLYKSTNSTEGSSDVVAQLEIAKDELKICLNNPDMITLKECSSETNAIKALAESQNNKDWCHSYSSSIPYSASVLCPIDNVGNYLAGDFWQSTPTNVKFFVAGALTVAAVVSVGGLAYMVGAHLLPATDVIDPDVVNNLNVQVEALTEVAQEFDVQITTLTAENLKGKAFIQLSNYVAGKGFKTGFDTLTKAMHKSPLSAMAAIEGFNAKTKAGVLLGLTGLEDVTNYITQAEGAAELLGNVVNAVDHY